MYVILFYYVVVLILFYLFRWRKNPWPFLCECVSLYQITNRIGGQLELDSRHDKTLIRTRNQKILYKVLWSPYVSTVTHTLWDWANDAFQVAALGFKNYNIFNWYKSIHYCNRTWCLVHTALIVLLGVFARKLMDVKG